MAERAGRIVAVGEVVADIYRDEVKAEDGRDRAAESGGMGFTARPGGAPANVAVAVARLGGRSAFVGSVGDDLFGEFILGALRAEGVDVSPVVMQKPPVRTSLAFVEIFPDGDREFTFYRSSPAADEQLAPEDIKPETLEGASFVNFGSIPLISDPSRSAVERVVSLANDANVAVAFDVNYRAHLWPSPDAARKTVETFMDRAQVVKLSEDETEPLLGVSEPESAADRLLERGARLVLVSLGPDGAFYATGTARGRIDAPTVEAVDATGAGDAFLAATLQSLGSIEAADDEARLREAVRRGTVAGAIACTGQGAIGPLPTAAEIDRFTRW
ncbi:Sugar kinases ribokinase family [Rubrobacter radiotolerans]|uniref:Carbohydrate kinase n=1 Tax=Rubrobacter radiotolerans TaxID=42256 RepID=A0A023X168_RUBRA|nr:carbohydrate kinase [Rubrobacter radiotolerans]AHY45814.1 Sugar kinases ribokinase family [Rubrobacter radiotolerans]MDX5893228.1 carbohydrate kinase [Rubrobacter radiotolerans]SMC03320.1 fructokinase [Rubrobacter radiotolerans DSM 5868]